LISCLIKIFINSQNLKNMKKNVSRLMQLLSLTIMLALVAPIVLLAQAGKVNFSGSWTLNESKSILPQGGGGGGMSASNLVVAQEANLLTRTSTGQDGTQRVAKYNLDGKESVNTTGGGESKSTAKWSDDGKSLTIVTKSNFNGTERTSTAVWSLTEAKALSIVTTRQSQDGEVKSTMVYDKK
jgi:hypothetical protein